MIELSTSAAGATWPEVTTAIATATTALVLAIAAAFAFQQARQARLLREAQVRPFVVIDFDAQSQQPLINLTITNHGTTLARNITFEFSPPLASTFDDKATPDTPKVADLNIFRRGISSLPPGKVISILFDTSIGRTGKEDAYAVRVRYAGERGKKYDDLQSLDLSIYWGSTYVVRRGIHDIHERMSEIKGLMREWRSSFGSGLLVVSPRDLDERRRRWKERTAKSSSDEPAVANDDRHQSPLADPPD